MSAFMVYKLHLNKVVFKKNPAEWLHLLLQGSYSILLYVHIQSKTKRLKWY